MNQNDILDYFGTTANVAARLQKESLGDDIVLSEEVWQDPGVQQILRKRGCGSESKDCAIRGLSGTRKVYVLDAKA